MTVQNTQKTAAWARVALGLSTAFAPIPSIAAERGANTVLQGSKADPKSGRKADPKSGRKADPKADPKAPNGTAYEQTAFTPCDAFIIAKAYGLTVAESKSLAEAKVAYGNEHVIRTALFDFVTGDDSSRDLSGIEYISGHPVGGEDIDNCGFYVEGLNSWYTGEAREFTYCDAELLSVYYDEKIRESKSLLGSKVAMGLADSVRTSMLEPAKEDLIASGIDQTSDFCPLIP